MSPEVTDYREFPEEIWSAVQYFLHMNERNFLKRDIHEGLGILVENDDGRLKVKQYMKYGDMSDGQQTQARRKGDWWALKPLDGRSKSRPEQANIYGDNSGTPVKKKVGTRRGRGKLRQTTKRIFLE